MRSSGSSRLTCPPLNSRWGTVGALAAAGAVTLATFTGTAALADPSPTTTTPTVSANTSESSTDESPPATPPALSLSPQQGSPGTSVTVTVTDLARCDGAVSLQFGTDTVRPLSGWSSDPASGGWSAQFAVPEAASSGSQDVTAQCGGASASSPFTVVVTPTLSVSPDHGEPGTAFTAVASGFGLCRLLFIRWDQDDPFFASSTSGASVLAEAKVPVHAVAGDHPVTASCGRTTAPPAMFTVAPPDNPALAMEPAQGAPGSHVTAVLSGFGECDAPTLRWDGKEMPTNPVGGDGLAVHFMVPAETAAGDHRVLAECEGHRAPATFTVVVPSNPTLTLDIDHGLPDARLIASGTGFDCGDDRVKLRWDDGTDLADASAGAFTGVPITVPSRASTGDHRVIASCEHHPGVTAGQPFTVTSEPAAAPPHIELQPASGHAGDRVQATGDRLPCSKHPGPVTLSWGNGTPIDASVDATGHLDAALAVPAGADAGLLTLRATCPDGVVLAADFTVLPSRPPLPPPPKIPWWPIVVLVGLLGLFGWRLLRRSSRQRPGPVAHSVHAVTHAGSTPVVALRETPAPGETTHAIRVATHLRSGTVTLRKVDHDDATG